MNKKHILLMTFGMFICMHSFAYKATPSKGEDYIWVAPGHTNLISGNVMGVVPAYRIPRIEDNSFLDEALEENICVLFPVLGAVEKEHPTDHYYLTGHRAQINYRQVLPTVYRGYEAYPQWYEPFDVSGYGMKMVNGTRSASERITGYGWGGNWFCYGFIDKRFEFSYKKKYPYPYSQSGAWILDLTNIMFDAFGITTNDIYSLPPSSNLVENGRTPINLHVRTNAFYNIKKMQDCNIRVGLDNYVDDWSFDGMDYYAEKKYGETVGTAGYDPTWKVYEDSSQSTVRVYHDYSQPFWHLNTSVTKSKGTAHYWLNPSNHAASQQKHYNLDASISWMDIKDGTGHKPNWRRGYSKWLKHGFSGGDDHVVKWYALAALRVEKKFTYTETVFNEKTHRSETISTNNKEKCIYTIPIEIKYEDGLMAEDDDYTQQRAWFMVEDNFLTLLKKTVPGDVAWLNDSLEKAIETVAVPSAPDVDGDTLYSEVPGRIARNSIKQEHNEWVYFEGIILLIECKYTTKWEEP